MRERCWGSVKPRFAMLKGVSTIQGENMQVDVQIELRAEVLDERHHRRAGTIAVANTCSLEDPARQRPGDHTEHSA